MALQGGIIGWILRGTRDQIAIEGISANQVLKVVHEYGFRLGHHLHLYVPDPPAVDDETAVNDMLEVLQATNVIVGGPYLKDVDRIDSWLRASKPRLFEHKPAVFKAYRINEDRLNRLISMLDAPRWS